MPKYQFDATRKVTYIMTVDAKNKEAALEEVRGLIAKDFKVKNKKVREISSEWTEGQIIELGN